MHLGMILEMASNHPADRTAFGTRDGGLSYADLGVRARRAGTLLANAHGERVALVDENSLALPIGLFGSAIANKPFVPINYRLADERLRSILARTAPALVIVGPGVEQRLADIDGIEAMAREDFLEQAQDGTIEETHGWECDPDAIAVLLFTSGTTGDAKAAVLRHRNLAAYLLGSVEFGAAAAHEAALVSVPPYHIAAVSSVLSTTYAGRRVVQLEHFAPDDWVGVVRAERITHAMVVPTMLGRILSVLETDGCGLPSLRSLAYGGGPMPSAVIRRTMELLPHVDLINAYGLTETSSTISVLGPDDHVHAFRSDRAEERARLGSVGQPLPGVEVSIRDPLGNKVTPGQSGEIWVRGEQVSGEYEGRSSELENGWFNTRDAGRMDEEGYLFLHGRLDDVIVRGGENLSPGEIEAVLLDHAAVLQAAVVGVPDVEWGEKVIATVVLQDGSHSTERELQHHVRAVLRSTRTPDTIVFVRDLPFNETGKLLRRKLREELAALVD